MLKQKTVIMSIMGVIVLALIGLVTAQVIDKRKPPQVSTNQTLKPQNSLQQDEATQIQEGLMTQKQKKHSKLFDKRGYEYVTAGSKKLSILAQETGRDVEIYTQIGDVIMPQSFAVDDYFHDLTCEADAVVIGDLKGKVSQLTENGTFVFSEYQFNVTQVLKNNKFEVVQPDKDITIVRSSGKVRLKDKNKNISTIAAAELPLKNNQTYLLFLKFIPETQSYISLGNELTDASFKVNDGLISQVSKQPLPIGNGKSLALNSLLTNIEQGIIDGCTTKGVQK